MDADDELSRALVLGFQGDFAACIQALELILETRPDFHDARFELAMVQFMEGKTDEGCANLRYILSKDPGHERAVAQAAYC